MQRLSLRSDCRSLPTVLRVADAHVFPTPLCRFLERVMHLPGLRRVREAPSGGCFHQPQSVKRRVRAQLKIDSVRVHTPAHDTGPRLPWVFRGDWSSHQRLESHQLLSFLVRAVGLEPMSY